MGNGGQDGIEQWCSSLVATTEQNCEAQIDDIEAFFQQELSGATTACAQALEQCIFEIRQDFQSDLAEVRMDLAKSEEAVALRFNSELQQPGETLSISEQRSTGSKEKAVCSSEELSAREQLLAAHLEDTFLSKQRYKEETEDESCAWDMRMKFVSE